MSFPQDGREMDRPPAGGSVRRARERAQAGLPPERPSQIPRLPRAMEDDVPQIAQPSLNPRRPVIPPAPGPSRLPQPRPQAPAGLQTRDGQIGVAISRPTQVPAWPLAGPINSPSGSSDSDPYRPPPGRSQPPQRPPRPSRVPSILDGSKIQDHTPVFQYKPQDNRESSGQDLAVVPETPSSLSRPSTVSSVASIPDFPLPLQMPAGPPRRSVNLGPPPSARRGASSFYSNLSYVSPIPEESPRSRSYASFASSAAMPESWGSPSPGPSPQYPEAFYDDTIAEEANPYDDDAEDSRLVRSASLGKRGKPVLVTTAMPRDTDTDEPGRRPDPVPLQTGPFKEGTGYLEASTSSSGALPTAKPRVPAVALTADSILDAYSAASSTDPSNPSRFTPSPQPPGSRPYSRLSAIRRPPQLDIDAVKKAQARGSLTSLPDLIRRATRLAASLEKGRRPASRMDDLSDFPDPESFGRDRERDLSFDGEKHQSGLSDMLAAFPPPAQAGGRRSIRESLRQQAQSWPLPLVTNRGQSNNTSRDDIPDSPEAGSRRRRRCCGMPFWVFILVVTAVFVIAAAAIILPIEFFVIRKQNINPTAQPALQQCQAQLNCQNGGTNVVNQDSCSCICTNGFTGSDCSAAAATGCTTTSLTGDTNISNVTLGEAIPRLIAQASTNFSIALSPTAILAKLNAGNLSCTAENALVTFDGRSTRLGGAFEVVTDPSGSSNAAAVAGHDLPVADGVAYDVVTVIEGPSTTATLDHSSLLPTVAAAVNNVAADAAGFSTILVGPTTFSDYFKTTISFARPTTTITPTLTKTVTTTIPAPTAPTPTAGAGSGFTVTEEILDFARVAVLFILQEDNLQDAEAAQNVLQRLFTTASVGMVSGSNGVSVDQAKNVTLGNGNSIDLIQYRVDSGGRLVGGKGPTA